MSAVILENFVIEQTETGPAMVCTRNYDSITRPACDWWEKVEGQSLEAIVRSARKHIRTNHS